jgi:hypothetical protein
MLERKQTRHIELEALWLRRGKFKIKPLTCNYLKTYTRRTY